MKNMNRRALVLLTLILTAFGLQAQGQARDRIKTLKVAFITEKVGLTSEEAQAFWPIYNKHEEDLETIRRKERMELRSQISSAESLSESESETLLDKMLALQNERHREEQDFMANIRKVIPAKKALLLIKAEEDFKRQLLQQYRKRKGGR
jgi:Skp family chaperone for outer membrane proteins